MKFIYYTFITLFVPRPVVAGQGVSGKGLNLTFVAFHKLTPMHSEHSCRLAECAHHDLFRVEKHFLVKSYHLNLQAFVTHVHSARSLVVFEGQDLLEPSFESTSHLFAQNIAAE